MTLDVNLQEIIRDGENDEPRILRAKALLSLDPEYAEFIDLQLNKALQRRALHRAASASEREKHLLEKNRLRWTSGLSELGKGIEFDRGFPSSIRVDPYVFLAKGAELFARAPIRHVSFQVADESNQFPLEEVLASPLLENLDALYLKGLGLTDKDVEQIGRSARLSRCLILDLSFNPIGFAAFHSLAKSPSMKNLLLVYRGGGSAYSYHPGQQLHEWTSSDWSPMESEWAPLGEDGRKLEQEFGYLPWLHPQDHECNRFDLRWFVQQGVFPKKPPGSPVEQ